MEGMPGKSAIGTSSKVEQDTTPDIGETGDVYYADSPPQVPGSRFTGAAAEEFLLASDFTDSIGIRDSHNSIHAEVVSVAPEADGDRINGYICNDTLSVRIKITGADYVQLMALYREHRADLDRALKEAIGVTGDLDLLSIVTFRGSLWMTLKVACKTAGEWMRKQPESALKWARRNKQEIDYWLGVTSHMVNIFRAVVQVLSWFFGGGGMLPGTT
jgi:hypothetical protein